MQSDSDSGDPVLIVNDVMSSLRDCSESLPLAPVRVQCQGIDFDLSGLRGMAIRQWINKFVKHPMKRSLVAVFRLRGPGW